VDARYPFPFAPEKVVNVEASKFDAIAQRQPEFVMIRR
jgi:hypothetical protein